MSEQITITVTSSGEVITGVITESGTLPTLAQNKLLGRGASSGTGTAEAITLGTNLTLSGTTLNAAGGSSSWGGITGTLSAQTDLQAALDEKLPLAGGTMTGAFATTGASSTISTVGSNATISTSGDSATIHTVGVSAYIHTDGSDAYIYTSGSNASISTNGDFAYIYTTGSDAYIYTSGENAYIQTRDTFKLFNGTHTTTLSHSPTANRAIAFPNAAGTVVISSDINNYITTALASPGAIGGTTPSTGAFTALSATGVTSIPAGSQAAPSISFSGDSNTGIYSTSSDLLDFTAGGSFRCRISGQGVESASNFRCNATTAAIPGIIGSNDTNTGLFFPGSDVMGISTNGLARWTITATGELAADATNGGGLTLTKTIIAPATTGAQTINRSSGRVNFAAAATSLVVTNSLCNANSIIHCTIATNDATVGNIRVVAGAGSFTIHLLTAPTSVTAVNFLLTN